MEVTRVSVTRRAVVSSGVLIGGAAGAGALLAACGSSGAGEPGGGGASKAPVELTFPVRNIAAEVKSWEDVFNVFIQQSNGKYTPNFVPVGGGGEAEYMEKISTMMAGGTPPDVFILLAKWKQDYVEKKLVMDLTSRAKASKTAALSLYLKPMQDAMQYKGKIWGTGEDYNTTVLLMNLTILKEAGVPKPGLNWTYDEFRELCKKLRKADKDIWGSTNWMSGASVQNVATLQSYGKIGWFDEKTMKATVNLPASVQAHELIQQMSFGDRTIPSPVAPQASGKGGDEGYYAFWASWANKPWQLFSVNKGQIPYEWTMQPFPKGPMDQKQGAQGHLYSIPADVKHVDAAWTLCEWIGGLEGWKQFVKIGRGIPLPMADKALWDEYYGFLPKEQATQLQELVLNTFYPKYSMDISYPPYFNDLSTIMTDAEKALFAQNPAAVKPTLDDAARKMDAVLDDAKKRAQ